MGSKGIKRRKPKRPLPKVRTTAESAAAEPNAATPLSPMGFPAVLGNVLHSTESRGAAGRAGRWIVALPLILVAVVAVLALVTR
jgi:hypothetical protein